MSASHILIVDDSASLRFLLTKTFESRGYRVTCAADIGEAARVAAEDRPEIVLLDQSLPSGRGSDLLAEWRRSGLDFPVVMMSVFSADNVLPDESTETACTYIAKPFELAQLVSVVRSLAESSTATA